MADIPINERVLKGLAAVIKKADAEARHQADQRGGEANSAQPDGFDEILEVIGDVEDRKQAETRSKLEANYQEWADAFELTKKQFGEVWELFGKICDKVPNWQRSSKYSRQYGFIGASGYGYCFHVKLVYTGGGSWHDEPKVLELDIGERGFSMEDGIGDEREIGRTTKLDENLVGLENCEGSLEEQLSGSYTILKYLSSQALYIKCRNYLLRVNANGGEATVGVGFLKEHSLKEICQRLFVALNKDEIMESFEGYLVQPKQLEK